MQSLIKKVCIILFFSVCTSMMYSVDTNVQAQNGHHKVKVGFLSSIGMVIIATWQRINYHALEKEIKEMHDERNLAKYWTKELQVCNNQELIKQLTKLRKEYRKKISIIKPKSKVMARRTFMSALIAGSCFAYDMYVYAR